MTGSGLDGLEPPPHATKHGQRGCLFHLCFWTMARSTAAGCWRIPALEAAGSPVARGSGALERI